MLEKIQTCCAVVLLALILSMTSNRSAHAEADEWRFELTPYVWLTSVDLEDATVRGQSASAELDFGDVWDLLDFAGFVRFEAWKGNWGFVFDGYHVDLGAEGDLTPRLGPVTFANISVDVDLKQTMMDFAVSYRFSMPRGDRKPTWSIEPIAGLRYCDLKERIDISKAAGPVLAAMGRTIEGSQWYVEPFVGGRLTVKLTENLAFALRGDVGGFGIAEASHLTWNLIAGFDYKPWESVSLKFGYRILDVNWDIGSGGDETGLDARLHGPALGVTFYF
ncbi:MAG: hypothetical protein JRJ85_28935 [Deltaproteobacteria bacterium]|nr:hypothetical protein [Deltaproteobacteria bacterium]